LEVLLYQVGLAYDLRFLRTDSYEHASRDLDAIGVMVGGWPKALPAR
jgi:hypothetical protein